jgi:ribosomal protein S18 acetylase RimI-like enzyme
MIENLEYRQAVPQDEDALVELWWDMQASHHDYEPNWYADKGEGPCKASWREYYRRLLQDKDAVIIVASSAGNPVGMIVARFTERPPIYTIDRMLSITSTVVHPDFRQKGIFAGMLSLLEKKVREAGIAVMKLSVHHRNEDAQLAYKKSGFIPETIGMIKWIE